MNIFEKALLDMKRTLFPMTLYWRMKRAIRGAFQTIVAPTEFARDFTKEIADERQKQVFGSKT